MRRRRSGDSFRFPIASLLVSLAAFSLLPRVIAAQEFYRWVDEKGSIHITDNPHSIPEEYRKQAEKRRLAPSREPAAPQQAQPASKSQTIVIPFTRAANAIIVEGIVNGSGTVKFILDTGASGTLIPISLARQLGINDKRGLFDLSSGIGGIVIAPLVEIDSINVGGAEVTNLDVSLQDLPGQGNVGLLGMDFLSQFRLAINHAKNELTLEPEPGPYEGRTLVAWQINFRAWNNLKKGLERLRSDPRFALQAKEMLQAVDSKLNDLEIGASQAGVPREFRQ